MKINLAFSSKFVLLVLLLHKSRWAANCQHNSEQVQLALDQSNESWPHLIWPAKFQERSKATDSNHWLLDPEYLESSFQHLISTNGCVPNPRDPDRTRNVSEIIVSRGYSVEEHDVITEDGYILNVQRIINPLARTRRPRPIILQHGLMSSSIDWVLNSADAKPRAWPIDGQATSNTTKYHQNSLAFYLANLGYDVFLSNSRGNIYGRRHTRLNVEDSKFWDFCFDEKILYDLPATINYVQRLTGSTKVGYVGFSQGAAMMFGLMADYPDYADQIEPFIAFGPVAYVDNALTPFKRFSFLTPFLQHMNAPFTVNRALVAFLATQVCNREVIQKEICANVFFLLAGFDEEGYDATLLPSYLCHMPSDTSVRNMAHYGQEIRSGRFAHFDFGFDANMAKYGRQMPPDYDLAKIRSNSMIFFVAQNDWLASPSDVSHLISSLRVKLHDLVNMTETNPRWNHIDFVYSKRVGDLVNTRVYQYLKEFE